MIIEPLISAFLIGLLGAGHCLGMCGGIAAAVAFSSDKNQSNLFTLSAYNIGRISSYTLLGALFGLIGETVIRQWLIDTGMLLMRTLAGVMLILMALYLSQIYMGLTKLEKVGSFFWRYIQPFGKQFLPVKNPLQAYFLGCIWGWLPCGLVYSILVFAIAQANPFNSALVMLAFGLGTFPAVFFGSLASSYIKSLITSRLFRVFSAVLLVIFGIWTILGAWQHQHHGSHDNHVHHHHHT